MHKSNFRFQRKLVGNLATELAKKGREEGKKPELLNGEVKSD